MSGGQKKLKHFLIKPFAILEDSKPLKQKIPTKITTCPLGGGGSPKNKFP
jgi:hypothetical protein